MLVLEGKAPMYKVILLDYSMPDMDGPQVSIKIRKIISSTGLAEPFICCCTAYSENVYRDRAIEAGMDFFLSKPITSEEINKIIVTLKS